jgi:hypothetical protein
VAADYVGHLPCAAGRVVGRGELRRLVVDQRLAHPDVYIKIEDEIAENDLVVMRWRSTVRTAGTRGTTDGVRTWSGISIIRLLAGRQVDAYTAVTPPAIDLVA